MSLISSGYALCTIAKLKLLPHVDLNVQAHMLKLCVDFLKFFTITVKKLMVMVYIFTAD